LIVADLRRRAVLLVVDNCEHVPDRVASIVGEIGRRCPGVVVLATSREGLALPGERIVAVPALGVPPDNASLEAAREPPAVRLFVDRAAAARQGFALAPETVRGCLGGARTPVLAGRRRDGDRTGPI
jgi:predicted ATPase